MITDIPGPSQQLIALATALERQRLQLVGAAFVLRIRQLLRLDSRPFMYQEASLPLTCFPAGVPARLASPYRICALARAHGILLGRAAETLSSHTTGSAAARILGIPVGAGILKLDRVVFASDGRPIEWRVGYFRRSEETYVQMR